MKHKETLIIIAISVAVVLFICCCGSSRKLINEEKNVDVVEKNERMAIDEAVIDYVVDTTRINEETVEIERIEYYDIQYWDSVAEVSKQLIRARQKTTIRKNESKNGLTIEHDSIRSYAEESSVTDSTMQVNHHEAPNTSVDITFLWLILIVLVIAFILKKKFL